MKNVRRIHAPHTLYLLRRQTLQAAGAPVTYHLLKERGTGYFARIFYRGETAQAFLHTDRRPAARLFTMLCRGRVTPCTLADIAEDQAQAF